MVSRGDRKRVFHMSDSPGVHLHIFGDMGVRHVRVSSRRKVLNATLLTLEPLGLRGLTICVKASRLVHQGVTFPCDH